MQSLVFEREGEGNGWIKARKNPEHQTNFNEKDNKTYVY